MLGRRRGLLRTVARVVVRSVRLRSTRSIRAGSTCPLVPWARARSACKQELQQHEEHGGDAGGGAIGHD